MFKKILVLISLITLTASINSMAADNLELSKHITASSMPSDFLQIGGEGFTSASFKDDDNILRTDKVFYTTTHSYNSSYPIEEIDRLLNPAEGKLGSLFEETTVDKSNQNGLYEVMMLISTPVKSFDCASKLRYSKFTRGNKVVHTYRFADFNMVFTGMVIQVEVEARGAVTKIILRQVAAIKGSTFKKLKSFFAVGRFEKALKENIKRFKDGVGGM